MGRAPSRLRWQLALSHLVVVGFTFACMIAAALLLAGVMANLRDQARREPANEAWQVARAIGGLVTDGQPAELNSILRALAAGQLRLLDQGPPFGPPAWRQADWLAPSLRDVAYIVVVGPDGRLLGSSDRSGAAFAPPERDEWSSLAAAALSSRRSPGALATIRQGDEPAALGAAPIFDASGRAVAAVVLARSSLAPSAGGFSLAAALAFFGAAGVAILAVAFVFALPSSSLVAYLLSRRLVARLERLGQAAEALAAGRLSSRVEEGPADEVGQLGRRFNAMAADLERTLGDLQAERDRVAGLLEARRQLVASVSHELRTPVATVRGYLESAAQRGPALPGELQADLATMQREVTRLQRLIDDLFTLSRAEVGRLELRLEPTDLGAVARRLAETSAPLAWRQRRVQVLAEVAPELPSARADAQRLEQVLSNLLSNAVRHTPPGGLVAVVASAEPAAVRIDVRDTGEGIAPEELPHIFERFYRGRHEDGRAGAGLGLALARELAEAMGGSVAASSAPGEGSCFTVRLPRAVQS